MSKVEVKEDYKKTKRKRKDREQLQKIFPRCDFAEES